jgi:O-succinylbenzoic acid--CoA ligase
VSGVALDAALPWLAARAASDGDREAIRFGDRTLSWKEMAARSEALASHLHARGVGRGDLVAVRMAPQPEFAALLYALQALGAAMLPLNLRLATAEVLRILAHARPRLLVDDGSGADVADAGLPRLHAHDDLRSERAPRAPVLARRLDPDAALTVVFTSGTTSRPKGVVLTNANHAAAAAASRARLGHGADDVWLATLPLFHVGGLAILTRSVLEGSRVQLETGFDAARAAAVLQSGSATMVSLVPTMLARVMELLREPPSARVRAVLIGGAALSPSLGRRALEAGLPIAATWGMTEACSQICTTSPGSDEAARGLVGRPLPGVEVTVAEPGADGFGELLVRGPNVTRGYLGLAEADRAAFGDADEPGEPGRGRWLRTGDVGRIEAGGAVALTGRRDDLVVTGGENVAPVEVEQVLDEHPGVRESLVFGEDDDEWGQRVVALVVAAGENLPPSEDLRAWCRARLAGYKVPREFRFTEALARGETGKLLRRRRL